MPSTTEAVQRSFSFRGDATVAEQRRRDLVEDFGVTRIEFTTVGARLSVGELMDRFFEAPHLWKPATVASHRPVVTALVADRLACRRLVALTPGDVRAAICRWQAEDMSVATVSARWLVVRSAISWAVGEACCERTRWQECAARRGQSPAAITLQWRCGASCVPPRRRWPTPPENSALSLTLLYGDACSSAPSRGSCSYDLLPTRVPDGVSWPSSRLKPGWATVIQLPRSATTPTPPPLDDEDVADELDALLNESC